jgi:hypothetical protein
LAGCGANVGFKARGSPLGTKQKIDGLALFVDRAIKISPTTFDLHVGLVDAPRLTNRRVKRLQGLSNSGT